MHVAFPSEGKVPATSVGFGILFVFYASLGYVVWFTPEYIKLEIPIRIFLGFFGSVLLILGFFGEINPIKWREIFRRRKRVIIAAFLATVVIVSSGFILLGISGPIPFPQEIPLTAAWKSQGPGAEGVRYENGSLVLTVNLNKSDDYGELFLDLTKVNLPNLEQNADGTFNLVGKRLNATVSSEYDFRGDPNHTNGVQFIVKNKLWNNSVGPWLDASPSMNVTGMDIYSVVPDESIPREVAGVSVKFTIGHGSVASYKGELFLRSIVVTSEIGNNWLYLLTFFASFPIAVVVATVFLRRTKHRSEVVPKKNRTRDLH